MSEELYHGPLYWGIADTAAEREEVYIFRYAHYYRNLPAAPGIDHRGKRVHLALDDISVHLTRRDAAGNLIIAGTGIRASTPDLPPEWREILRLDILATLGLDTILIFSRLVEHEAYRGSRAFPAFFKYSANYFVERGYAYSIHYCAPALVPLYERVGYRVYGAGYTMRSGLFRLPMILAGTDASCPATVNTSITGTVHGASGDLQKLHAVVPETKRPTMCAMSGEERVTAARAILAPHLEPGETTANHIPDKVGHLLRRAFLLPLSPGDSPAHPTDQPLFWFVLEGEMALRLKDGGEGRASPGTFINGYAIASYSAPHGGNVIALTPGKALQPKEPVLAADFWQSLA